METRAARRWVQFVISGVVVSVGWGCGGGGGGGGSPTEPPLAPQPNVVTIEVVDDAYAPQRVTIQPGDTVRWVLDGDHAGHTVTDRNGAFDSGFVFQNPGDSYERTFPAAEQGRIFEYSCVTHRDCCGMRGSVRVGDSAPAPSPGY